jgi:hypothetical protein
MLLEHRETDDKPGLDAGRTLSLTSAQLARPRRMMASASALEKQRPSDEGRCHLCTGVATDEQREMIQQDGLDNPPVSTGGSLSAPAPPAFRTG